MTLTFRKIRRAFRSYPVMPGFPHPIESEIREWMAGLYPWDALRILEQWCLRNPGFASDRADLLSLIARMGIRAPNLWKGQMVRRAGHDRSDLVREAAIGAAEYWRCEEVLDALESWKDDVPYLDHYRRQIRVELCEEFRPEVLDCGL